MMQKRCNVKWLVEERILGSLYSADPFPYISSNQNCFYVSNVIEMALENLDRIISPIVVGSCDYGQYILEKYGIKVTCIEKSPEAIVSWFYKISLCKEESSKREVEFYLGLKPFQTNESLRKWYVDYLIVPSIGGVSFIGSDLDRLYSRDELYSVMERFKEFLSSYDVKESRADLVFNILFPAVRHIEEDVYLIMLNPWMETNPRWISLLLQLDLYEIPDIICEDFLKWNGKSNLIISNNVIEKCNVKDFEKKVNEVVVRGGIVETTNLPLNHKRFKQVGERGKIIGKMMEFDLILGVNCFIHLKEN